MGARGEVTRVRWRGEPALALRAGATRAVFLPELGLTGVSLTDEGREFVAVPDGPAAIRAGHTQGLPLLAPWANRLAGPTYRVGRVTVPVRGPGLHRDGNGLAIHGLLVGAPGWRITGERTGAETAGFVAAIDVDAPVFPFPHRIEVRARLTPRRLAITTTVVPTTRRAVPIAFGWHPYLRLPGAPRARWRLGLPAAQRCGLDARNLPTGERVRVPAEAEPIGRQTFDDLYALGRSRVLSIAHDTAALTVRADRGYPYAQVWVPPGRPFVALEPMTAPVNALGDGVAPVVASGDRFRAAFALEID